jgi:hypothetical protein
MIGYCINGWLSQLAPKNPLGPRSLTLTLTMLEGEQINYSTS